MSKISKSFSSGIIILIFLLLFIQFVFFALKAVDSYKPDRKEIKSEIVSKDTITKGNNYVPSKDVQDVPRKSATPIAREKKQPSQSNLKKKVYSPRVDTLRYTKKKPFPKERKYHKFPIEINKADTSDFNSLYGIGAYFAKKIVEHREALGGSFVDPKQLMEVWGIDSSRFNSFSDRLFVDSTTIIHIDLYTMEIDSLAKHPYVGSYAAKGIERYRRMVIQGDFTVDKLIEYNIISPDKGAMLKLYHKCVP